MALTPENRLRLITEAGKILSSSLRSQTTLQHFAELICSCLADVCVIELFRDDGSRERVAIASPNHLEDVEAIISGAADQPDPVYIVPMPIDGGTSGLVTLVRRGGEIGADDLTLIEDLARHAALSIENARLYQKAQDALLRVRNQAADIRKLNEDLERRVVERTVQLEAANREMSIVNYTVSHDLRAPLRAIQGYSQMLLEDFGTEIPEGAKDYLSKLTTSTRQINRLLDGLLNFCKVSSHTLNREMVAINDVVGDAVETLRPRIFPGKLELRIAPLGNGRVDSLLIKQVFVNLISNAITYSSGRDIAVIQIGQNKEMESGEPVFFVRDNGIGFDPMDHARLFEPFRRLHSGSGYEGTGVGLTIVAGIVQRHGGRIWAECVPGDGATFYFTLGLRQHSRLAS